MHRASTTCRFDATFPFLASLLSVFFPPIFLGGFPPTLQHIFSVCPVRPQTSQDGDGDADDADSPDARADGPLVRSYGCTTLIHVCLIEIWIREIVEKLKDF